MGDTPPYKVLVAEKISLEGIEKLKERFEVDAYAKMSREDLLDCIGRYDALVVRSGTMVDSEVIEKAENLKIIGRAGIGIDNIDVEAATRKGVMVANVPESNIISAAEHTMAMLMAVARNIPEANISLSGGEWNRSAYQGVELYGKTLGIIGLGRIGALVAERALGFGMKLAGYDPFISAQKAKHLGVELKGSLDEVIQVADFITLHVPRNEETYHLIGKEQLAMAKDSVRIVNVSRGGVVDEEALADAMDSGVVAGAAIDVFEHEPPVDSRLCKMPGVVVTPHLGASTTEAQYKAGVAIAEQVIAALEGEFVGGAVNIAMPHKEVVEALKPYLPLCEKLGKLITHLVHGVIDEIEFETLGSISEYDTSLLTVALLKGFLENVSTESVTYVNAPMLAMERGITLRESKSRQSRDYLNLINVSARDDRGRVTAGATLVGKDQEMLVNVLDFSIDIAPSKHLAFIRYEDRPGMIGRIGSILGENNINIASLRVGRRKIDGDAAMGITLDRPITPGIKDQLNSEDGIVDVIFIFL